MISASEFKRLLKERGLTQKEVAARVGRVPSWLSRKISGAREMNCDELLEICRATGIAPTELLGYEAPDASPETADERVSRELAAMLPDSIVDALIRIREKGK